MSEKREEMVVTVRVRVWVRVRVRVKVGVRVLVIICIRQKFSTILKYSRYLYESRH